jgi:hypothetical protein
MSGSQWDAASQNAPTNLGRHIGGAPYFNIDTVTATSGFCTQYCGWHDHTAVSGSDIKYAFVGNAETHDGQEHADKCALELDTVSNCCGAAAGQAQFCRQQTTRSARSL